MGQFISFIQKEFYHIFRDVRTMIILLVIPVILIILFGYAITTEIKSAPVAVLDYSRDDVTEKLVRQLQASEYFELYRQANHYEEIEDLFRKGKIRMAIVFPPQFSSTNEPSVQILVDATDPNEATSLTQYAAAIFSTSEILTKHISADNDKPGIMPSVNLLYNPQMKGAYNFVPGVMGLILILICAMMTSVGIVKEKELGTMEVLLVSPLKPIYIILAKATPYLMLSIVNIITILLLSRFLLDVPINGSVILLFLFSILYALVALCLGLMISTIADTQQAAMLISGVVLMLPVILLSGMVFPIENMPWILRVLSDIVPAKWYIMGIKDVMIKGVGLSAIWIDICVLTGMALLLVILSVKRFKIRLQ